MTGEPTTQHDNPKAREATIPSVRRNTTTDASWIAEQVRSNVRMLKSVRKLSDTKLAELAGYSTRQSLSNRMIGRTEFTPEDFARLAAALRVEPYVLMFRMDEALRWVEDHPNFKPPKYKRQPKQTNKARAK